jgi:hypothetical protein
LISLLLSNNATTASIGYNRVYRLLQPSINSYTVSYTGD